MKLFCEILNLLYYLLQEIYFDYYYYYYAKIMDKIDAI